MTTDLTEANLEKALLEIRQLAADSGERIAILPTKIMFVPALVAEQEARVLVQGEMK